MASNVGESAGGPLSRLHLLPWHFRLLIGAVIAAALITLALSEFTIRSALNGLLPVGSELVERLKRIESLVNQRLEVDTTIITLVTAGQRNAAVDLLGSGRGKQLMNELREELEAIETQSQAELQVLQVRQRRAAVWSRLALLASTVIAIVLLLLVVRHAINQATAELHLHDEATRNSFRMEDIIASRTAELIDLWSHLQSVTEREKADLARNLHDELGGLLTAARMDLSWLQKTAEGKDAAVLERLQQLADEITEAMDVKRRVVENLRPALLDHFGLPTALKNHFEETCIKAGLSCTTEVLEDITKLPDDVSIALFRVGQESLTNIVRHAQARNVHLEINVDGDDLTLIITDDGVGMDVQMDKLRHSHGIRGMRHRIESLGGKFDLQSKLKLGTKIQIRIPRQLPPVSFTRATP